MYSDINNNSILIDEVSHHATRHERALFNSQAKTVPLVRSGENMPSGVQLPHAAPSLKFLIRVFCTPINLRRAAEHLEERGKEGKTHVRTASNTVHLLTASLPPWGTVVGVAAAVGQGTAKRRGAVAPGTLIATPARATAAGLRGWRLRVQARGKRGDTAGAAADHAIAREILRLGETTGVAGIEAGIGTTMIGKVEGVTGTGRMGTIGTASVRGGAGGIVTGSGRTGILTRRGKGSLPMRSSS